jgi:membrane AbrB-like protein
VSVLVLVALLTGGAAGAALGRLMRLPMWPLTGALIGAGAVHLAVGGGNAIPSWCVFTAQVLVGSTLGASLGPGVLREFREVMFPGLMTVLVTVVAGLGLGLGLWYSNGMGLVEALFGMVPGGVGEMVAAVASIGGDSALVAGMHLVRVLVVVSAMGAAVRWLQRRGEQGHDGGR